MAWTYPEDFEIKGVSTLADLLARPFGDTSMEKHLIVPDAGMVNPGWIGQDFSALVQTLPMATRLQIANLNDPAKDLNASQLFMSGLRIENCKLGSINLSYSVLGSSNVIVESEIGILSHSRTHSLSDIEGHGGGHYKGLLMVKSTFNTIGMFSSSHRHLIFEDCLVSTNLVIEDCNVEHIYLRQHTRLGGLVFDGTNGQLTADFARVAINDQPFRLVVPLALAEGIRQLQANW